MPNHYPEHFPPKEKVLKILITHWDFELFSSSNQNLQWRFRFKPLLKRPQECQGCQKNRKDLRFLILVRFCANIKPKLKKLKKTFKINKIRQDMTCVFFQILINFSWILVQKRTKVRNFRSFRFFWHPEHPWGRLSSGDTWVLRFFFEYFTKVAPLGGIFQFH